MYIHVYTFFQHFHFCNNAWIFAVLRRLVSMSEYKRRLMGLGGSMHLTECHSSFYYIHSTLTECVLITVLHSCHKHKTVIQCDDIETGNCPNRTRALYLFKQNQHKRLTLICQCYLKNLKNISLYFM